MRFKVRNMKAIVACDNNWGIGKNGDLLVKLPGDLRYFRDNTKDKTIIIGRKTLESFPGGKPLPNRLNIVLTRNAGYDPEGVQVCKSIEELNKYLEGEAEAFVCGGGEIYRQMLPYCDEVLVTKIDGDFNADTFFPNLDEYEGFECTWESEVQEDNGVKYKFTKYERV